MTEAEIFLRGCAAHARTLTAREATQFLRGMILVCPETKAMEPFRGIYNSLMESDHQLELIHCGQLKLEFGKKNGKS